MSSLTFTPSHSLATSILAKTLRGDGQTLTQNILLILGGSILIALSAQIAIPLAFTPIPITGQTFAILMVGMVLGSRRGALAVVAYLIEGASGLPVFAGGTSGIIPLLGPTAGFLFGFIPAAFLVGFLAERGWGKTPLTTGLAMILGNAVIYIFGLTVLSMWLGTTLGTTLTFGFLPFYMGDVLKLILAAALMPLAWKFLGQQK